MALILAVSVAWTTVALAHLFRLWLWSSIAPLTRWVSGLTEWVADGILGLAWLVAVTVTVMVAVAFRLTHRSLLAGMALVLSAAGAIAITRVDWDSAFVHGFYQVHRADFRAVAELARSRQLGGDLPPDLRHLALNGDPITYGPDSSSVWLPAWTGMVDGAVGYAFIGDPPAGAIVDCLGDPCLVRWSLGDGWSWLDVPHVRALSTRHDWYGSMPPQTGSKSSGAAA